MAEVTAFVSDNAPIRFYWRGADPHRGLSVAAFAGALAALVMARLGLPPIDIHSPLHHLGVMDPLCGITRAVVALARGDVGTALLYNPASLLLAVGAGFICVRSVIGLTRGRWLAATVRWRRTSIVVIVVLALALWANQQLHADLLMQFGFSK